MKTVVIVGATGSGKTGLSIDIAKYCARVYGKTIEIISADSRAIYKELDIGTAKPSLRERNGVVHHGFDLVDVNTKFNVAEYKKYVLQKIIEIENRGNIAMIVGGTGLYVDAVIYDYKFNNVVKNMCSDREKMSTKFIVYGIKWEMSELRDRLKQRLYKIFTHELEEETKKVVQEYGWDNSAMTSNVYKYMWGYINGLYSKEEAMELAWYDDYHLAKRQMTWFKRNKNIIWGSIDETRLNVLKCIQDGQRK